LQQAEIGVLAVGHHHAGGAIPASRFVRLERLLAQQARGQRIGQFAFADPGRAGKQQGMRQTRRGPRQVVPYFII
jgi:hypothetical protein